MVTYEYRMIPREDSRRKDGMADDMTREMNLRAILGWEYVGTEIVAEKRRGVLSLLGRKPRQFLVYRRLASARVPVPADQARAVEDSVTVVQSNQREMRRSELVAEVKAGKRRIRPQSANADQPSTYLLVTPTVTSAAVLAE